MTWTDSHWLQACPTLAAISDPTWRQAAAGAERHFLRARRRLFANNALQGCFLIVISGRVQVYRAIGSRELTLYRLASGDVCLYNALGHLTGQSLYDATAIAETDVEIMSLSAERFQEVFSLSADFRAYVLRELADRIGQIMRVLDGIVFQRLDVRLAQLLLARVCGSDECVCATHQEIASDLGSSREVISRLLKEFERKGWIGLARGEIQLRAPTEMHDFILRHVGLNL